MAEDGSVTDIVLDIYRNLARGGIGMIITGLMAVSQKGKGVSGQICIYDDQCTVETAKIAETVHAVDNNCAVIAQLCHFPILIKLNCDDHITGGITKETFPEILKEITDTGVDAIEVSGGMWDCLVCTEDELGFAPVPIPESRTHIDEPDKQSYYYNYVRDLHLPIKLILVGGNRNIEQMESIIQEGHVDFLSLSRPLIAEPNLPDRWLHGIGSENAHCVSCNACLLFKDEFGCAMKRLKLNRKEFETGYANGWRAEFK